MTEKTLKFEHKLFCLENSLNFKFWPWGVESEKRQFTISDGLYRITL